MVVSQVRLVFSARAGRVSLSMFREGISGYSLKDLSAKYMTGQVLGQSMGGRLLVEQKVRLKRSARADRVNPRTLRVNIVDHSVEDVGAIWMDLKALDGRARVVEFWCGFGSDWPSLRGSTKAIRGRSECVKYITLLDLRVSQMLVQQSS